MLISHSHRFVFVHIPKTAGTSLTRALAPFSNPNPDKRFDKIKSKLGYVSDPASFYLPKHADYRYAEKRLGKEAYDQFYKFAFVRNPWDLLVSYYAYIQKKEDHHRRKKVSPMSDFSAYLDYEISRNKAFQYKMICNEKKEIQVDFVGRFESLASDFDKIADHLGIEASLPHINTSKHRPYQEAYTPELRDRVAEHWKDDIEIFGYQFD